MTIMAGETWQREQVTAVAVGMRSHISAEQTEEEENAGAGRENFLLFSSLPSSGFQPIGWCRSHSGQYLPPSIQAL